MEMEKKYTHAYGQLRRLTSTIDGQIRQLSVSKKAMARFHHAVLFKKRPKDAYACVRARVYPSRGDRVLRGNAFSEDRPDRGRNARTKYRREGRSPSDDVFEGLGFVARFAMHVATCYY